VGLSRDSAEAVRWYRMAAEQGLAPAQFNLGVLFDEGTGVPEDDSQAASWYRRAAEQGHPDAQLNLGILYAIGSGVGQDPVLAHQWFDLATRSHLRDLAAKNIERLERSMTAEQIAEAERLAREWKPTAERE